MTQQPAEERGGTVVVCGVGLWLPGVAHRDDFAGGQRGLDATGEETPAGKALNPRIRRRTSRLSRAMAEACGQATEQAGFDQSSMVTVFGSSFGESSTMLALLDQLCRGEEMSPMGFATSVHSAASGAISISNKNRAFTTSLSADMDTSAAALLEAWGLLQQRQAPVVVVCGDDRSPADFISEDQRFELLAVSLALCPKQYAVSNGHRALGSLKTPKLGEPTLTAFDVMSTVGRNPQAGLLDLAAAIVLGRSGSVRLDRGRGAGYCVTFDPC